MLKALKVYNCSQVNIWKLLYLNCVEWCEWCNLNSWEIKAWKKIEAWTGFEAMTSAILVQCSTNCATKPTDSRPLCDIVTEYTHRRWRIQSCSVIVVHVVSLSKDGNILTKAKKGLNFARKCNHSNTRESILSHIQTVGRDLKSRCLTEHYDKIRGVCKCDETLCSSQSKLKLENLNYYRVCKMYIRLY